MVGKGIYKFVNIRRDGILLVILVISTIVAGLVPPAIAILTGRVFNLLVKFERQSEFVDLSKQITIRSMAIMVLGAISLPFVWASITSWMLLGERQGFEARRKSFQKYLTNSFEWYDLTEDVPGKVTQLNRCVEELRASSAETSAVVTRSLVTIVALICTSLYSSWSLTLITICTAPIIILSALLFSRIVQRYADTENMETSNASQLVDWSMNAAQLIRLSGTHLKEIQKFKVCIQRGTDNFIKVCQYASINSALLRFLTLLMFVQAFWFGSTMVRKGKLNIGDVITCFHSCILLGSTINGTLHQLVVLQKGAVAVNHISKLLRNDDNVPVDVAECHSVSSRSISGDIIFRDVDFAYPSRPDQEVLRKLSLKFHEKSTTFILGKSGAGKSSLANLLLKLYSNFEGKIFVDGMDIKHLEQNWLIMNITVVEQRCTVFNGTLRSNILLNFAGIDEKAIAERLRMVCRISLLESLICDLPNGLDTILGIGGITLSGGQQQKVAIARALMKDSPVLILDESLSALDIVQRRLILKAIRMHRKDKTTIILTHELSNITSGDFCYILEKGSCVEEGYEQELVSDPSTKFYYWKHLNDAYDNSDSISQLTTVETPIKNKDFALESVINFEVDTPKVESSNDHNKFEFSPVNSDFSTVSDHHYTKRRKKERIRITEFPVEEIMASQDKEPKDEVMAIPSILKRMFENSSKKLWLCLGITSSLLAGAANPIFSYTFSYLLTGIAPRSDGIGAGPYLLKWSLIVTGVAAADAIFNFLKDFILGYCSEYWIMNLRIQVMQKISFQELDWFSREDNNTSEVAALLLNDLRDLRALASDFLNAISNFVVVSVVGIVWALVTGWKLSLVCISMFPLLIILSVIYGIYLQKQETQYKDAVACLENLVYEAVKGVRTIRWLQAEECFLRRYREPEDRMRRMAFRRALTTGLGVAVAEVLTMCMQAILFYFALMLVLKGDYTTKQMFETFTLLLFTILTCNNLVNQIPDISRGQRAATRIYRIIDERNKSKTFGDEEDKVKLKANQNCSTSISIRNLTFAYPNAPDVSVLKDLNLELSPDRTYAVVGESGSGKSTLIYVLTQLYTSTAGSIFVDGINVNDWDIHSLRSEISVVEQKPTLFPGTIRDNLIYGVPREVLEVELYDILKYVDIYDFLSELPLGLETDIDTSSLSGGQAQRLCIARGLLRKPKILLLDECTSALDPSSSHIINDIVRKGPPARLTISITHNVDMMKSCNEVLFLKHGKVIANGTFDELYANSDVFRTFICDEQ